MLSKINLWKEMIKFCQPCYEQINYIDSVVLSAIRLLNNHKSKCNNKASIFLECTCCSKQ